MTFFQWKDILEIAKHCKELDISSNSSGESEKDKSKDQEKTATEEEDNFQSDIDLFADLERSLSDDYKKFLFG